MSSESTQDDDPSKRVVIQLLKSMGQDWNSYDNKIFFPF